MAAKKESGKRKPRKDATEALPNEVRQGSGVTEGVDNRSIGELLEDKARVERYHRWFRQSSEQTEKWRDAHIENLKFLSNDQWSDADKEKLEKQGRPALVINRSSSIIFTVSGLQRRARQEVKLLPFEPDDIDGAELMEVLVKWVRDQNNMKQIDSDVFTDKITSGIGFWKLSYDFTERPQGEIRIERRAPLNIFWDPNWPDAPWKKTEYVMDSEWFTLDQALGEFPSHEKSIRQKYGEWLRPIGQGGGEMAGDSHEKRRFFWDPQTQRIRILQVWYKKTEKIEVAVFSDGEVESDPDRVEEIKATLKDLPPEAKDSVAIVERPVVTCHVAHVLDDIELSNEPSPLPFNDFPIVPALGYYFWEKPFGLMDMMKDPQREKNKRRTALTEIVGRSAKSGFMNQEGVGADPGDLENYATGAGVVINYKQTEPRRIDPPQLDQTLVLLEQAADREIREVVNVNDELLGQTTQTTVSGRAIEARQRGGLITQEPLFDSFSDEMAEVTRLVIEMVKDNMTEEEAIRILGSLAIREPENEAAAAFSTLGEDGRPVVIEGITDILSRAFSTKYDVVISLKPFDASHAMAQFNAWVNLMQQIPNALPLLLPIVLEKAIDAGLTDRAGGRKLKAQLEALQQAAAAPQQPQQAGGGQLPASPDQVAQQMGGF